MAKRRTLCSVTRIWSSSAFASIRDLCRRHPAPDPRMRNRAGSAAARKLTVQRAVPEQSGSLRRSATALARDRQASQSVGVEQGACPMKRAACRFLSAAPRRAAGAFVMAAAMAPGVGVMSSAAPAEDLGKATSSQLDASRLTYARLYCTSDNESHFGEATAELIKQDFAPPAASINIGGNRPASSVFFAGFEAHWGAADLANRLYHPTPAVQLLTVVGGLFSITTTDGATRQLRPGDVVHLEDVAPCKGHITVVGDTTGFLVFAR